MPSPSALPQSSGRCVSECPHARARTRRCTGNTCSASEIELQELIEAVVVPETWFFRDREAFGALTRTRPCGVEQPAGRTDPARVESAVRDRRGAVLHSHGSARYRMSQRAVFRSTRSISASASSPTPNEACTERTPFVALISGFAIVTSRAPGQSYQLSDAVRQHVHFRQANLFASGAFPEAHSYDFIFCRNVLIYFDRAGQKLAVRLLGRLLTPGGTIFVGPSESALLLDLGYTSAKIPLAFAFRRATGAAQEKPLQPFATQPPPRQRIPETRVSAPPAVVAPKASHAQARLIAPKSTPKLNPESLLEEAQRLADQGKVAAAMQICQRVVNDGAPSAQAFYLLGLLHDTKNEHLQASTHYRKALYLDPTHTEAMLHLAEALIRTGATTEAQRLFDRAKRTLPTGAVPNE